MATTLANDAGSASVNIVLHWCKVTNKFAINQNYQSNTVSLGLFGPLEVWSPGIVANFA